MVNVAKLHFILGGARSGKSSIAEREAMAQVSAGKKLIYIATAQADDGEMADRIQQHQQDRAESWHTIECPLSLAEQLHKLKSSEAIILVDCLTLWLSNWLCQKGLASWQDEKQSFHNVLKNWADAKADLFLVSNEVGQGIVPLGELSRQFVDESGWLHQDIASVSQKVDFVMAGLALNLKQEKGNS